MNWKCIFHHKVPSVDPNGKYIQKFECERCGETVYLDNKGYNETGEGHQYTEADYYMATRIEGEICPTCGQKVAK